MIALNSSVNRAAVQMQPQPQPKLKPQAQAKSQQADGVVPTIERYRAAKDRQRKLEADARQAKKEADTLETALADATEANGGMLSAGPYVLGFEMKPGTPAYKAICEELIAENGLPPDTLLNKTAETPMRRVLVIA